MLCCIRLLLLRITHCQNACFTHAKIILRLFKTGKKTEGEWAEHRWGPNRSHDLSPIKLQSNDWKQTKQHVNGWYEGHMWKISRCLAVAHRAKHHSHVRAAGESWTTVIKPAMFPVQCLSPGRKQGFYFTRSAARTFPADGVKTKTCVFLWGRQWKRAVKAL